MSDWIKRPFIEDWDFQAVSALWLRSYTLSSVGRVLREKYPDGEYFGALRALVTKLLCSDVAKTEVICDPSRAVWDGESAPIIWAFACTTGDDFVHYTVVKNSAVRLGLSRDILTDLLGSRLAQRCFYTFDPVEFTPSRCLEHGIERPAKWRPDTTWLAINLP